MATLQNTTVPNGGTIGSVDDADSITIATNGTLTFSSNTETATTKKIKQKGAFLQSSTHQALTLGA